MGAAGFDEKAKTWDDDPAKVERAAVVAQRIRAAIPLDRSMRLLEYGAGTGLVTQALRDDVGAVVLADSSSGMREVVASKIAAGEISDAAVWALDLEEDPAPDERFDLIVTVMTLHHVHRLDAVLTGFAGLLGPDGRLCVVDLEDEDGSDHVQGFHGKDFHGHHGFRRPAMAGALAAAGFVDVAVVDCHHTVRDGVAYPLFLATCAAPSDGSADADDRTQQATM